MDDVDESRPAWQPSMIITSAGPDRVTMMRGGGCSLPATRCSSFGFALFYFRTSPPRSAYLSSNGGGRRAPSSILRGSGPRLSSRSGRSSIRTRSMVGRPRKKRPPLRAADTTISERIIRRPRSIACLHPRLQPNSSGPALVARCFFPPCSSSITLAAAAGLETYLLRRCATRRNRHAPPAPPFCGRLWPAGYSAVHHHGAAGLSPAASTHNRVGRERRTA